MKCVTVHQPWGWAIAQGHKRIENRSWATRHRGPILIHAGQSRRSLAEGRSYCERLGHVVPSTAELVFGGVVAIANLVDCVPFEEVRDEPFAQGPWCWILEDACPIAIPYRMTGLLGLFNVADDEVAGILGNDLMREWSGRIGVTPSFPGW